MTMDDVAYGQCAFCLPGIQKGNLCLVTISGLENYQCTRERGHLGNHVACGVTEHKIGEWKNGVVTDE